MSNILSSKKKMQVVIGEVSQRLAICVYVLEALKNAPHPSLWTIEDKQRLDKMVNEAIANARRDL